jgi:hypothetical protein
VFALRIGTVKNSKNFFLVVGPAHAMIAGVGKESDGLPATRWVPYELRQIVEFQRMARGAIRTGVKENAFLEAASSGRSFAVRKELSTSETIA